MSSEDRPDSISELIRKLSEIESAIEASSLDQVDVIVDPKTAKPILLRPAQEALIASKNQLEEEVLNKAAELERTIGDLNKEIQERKKAEESLRHNEEKFHLIADFTYDWEYWVGPDGKLIYMSPSCERITGYKRGEFIKDPNLLLVSELGIGLAWASILAMPYAILTGSLPAEKMGVYMGIFNFFIVIPQITAASILGFFVRNIFGGEAIYALVLGGASMVIASLMVLFVDDVD